MIPQEFAQIEWDEDRSLKCTRTIVFDRRHAPDEEERQRLYVNSLGACTEDWLKPDTLWANPEGAYLAVGRHGFANEEAHLEALQQFAKIDGCGWARRMANALLARMINSRPEYGGLHNVHWSDVARLMPQIQDMSFEDAADYLAERVGA